MGILLLVSFEVSAQRKPKPRPSDDKGVSGKCCLWKGPQVFDCSLDLMNTGHPQDQGTGLYTFGHNRCVQVNQGQSCRWDYNNLSCKVK